MNLNEIGQKTMCCDAFEKRDEIQAELDSRAARIAELVDALSLAMGDIEVMGSIRIPNHAKIKLAQQDLPGLITVLDRALRQQEKESIDE